VAGPVLRRLPLGLACLALLGCAPRPAELVFAPEAAATAAAIETVLVASSRAPDPGPSLYANHPGAELSFARFDVAVPSAHIAGGADPRTRPPGDPERHFLVVEAARIPDEGAFLAALNRRLAADPVAGRPAAVFVHGFRNSFADGVFYQAQLQSDLDRHGAIVHFAWPSNPSNLTYFRDVERALASRDALAQTIDLVAGSDAGEILLVGPSLGAFLLMDTLRGMALAGHDAVFDKIAAVVLVGADIDLDVFRAQAAAVAARGVQIVVVTSRRDRALRVSAALRGTRTRVGSAPPETLAGLPVAVLDVTGVPVNETYRHLFLARSPDLLRQIRDVHDAGAPDTRHAGVPRLAEAVRGAAPGASSPAAEPAVAPR
jgi:esterase/lipase superfamily enzyme